MAEGARMNSLILQKNWTTSQKVVCSYTRCGYAAQHSVLYTQVYN